MNTKLLTRLQVEDFVYHEADLLDKWALDDWLALWTMECSYIIGPTGKSDALTLNPATTLFLVTDDRFRLEQRVIRMKKPTAHAEYPHSRTRHLYTNVRITEDDGKTVKAVVNFSTFRTARNIIANYFGRIDYTFETSGSGDDRSFKIAHKRITLDLDSLVPHGKVTIFL
jgi:p-cumate 2,3-dioxygenase subunit beta